MLECLMEKCEWRMHIFGIAKQNFRNINIYFMTYV